MVCPPSHRVLSLSRAWTHGPRVRVRTQLRRWGARCRAVREVIFETYLQSRFLVNAEKQRKFCSFFEGNTHPMGVL